MISWCLAPQADEKGEDGLPQIVEAEAKIVRLIYKMFLEGKTPSGIASYLTQKGIPTPAGKQNWQHSTVKSILKNEKYMGDAILHKGYTVDFLTKKRAKNEGQLQSFYVEESHEAIIEPDMWKCTQLEMERRNQYMKEHEILSYGRGVEKNPFSAKVICGECNRAFARKGWQTQYGKRLVWQCSERYKIKGVVGCINRHVDEETLNQAFVMGWNSLVSEKEKHKIRWKQQQENENLLIKYRATKISRID